MHCLSLDSLFSGGVFYLRFSKGMILLTGSVSCAGYDNDYHSSGFLQFELICMYDFGKGALSFSLCVFF